jgi:methyl-accepting chemotaxis protein
MKRSLALRIFLVYLPIDLFFALALCFAHVGLFDLERPGPFLVVNAGLWVLRFFGWSAVVASRLRPVAEFSRAGSGASENQLLEAQRALADARARLGVFYGVGWMINIALATAYMSWLYPAPEAVSPFSLEGSLLLMGAVVSGAIVFSYPLILVLSNPEASALSLAIRARGLEARRPGGSLQGRITLLALGLAGAPTLFVASLGYTSAGLSGIEMAQRDARVAAHGIVAEARRLGELGDDVARATLSTRLDGERSGGLIVDRSGRPLHGGSALQLLEGAPALKAALAESVRIGEEGVRIDRSAGIAMALIAIDDERVAVAIVASSRDGANTFLIVAIAFVLTVLVWAPLSAVLFSRSIALPISLVTSAVRRLVEEGRLDELGALPVVSDDEIGQLGSDFNELLDLLRSLSHVSREIATGRLDVRVEGAGDLPDAFRGMLESLRDMVGQMSETSLQLGSAATEIFAATQEQEMAATTQSSSMREISQTMESLSESAAHVAEAVEGVLGNAERTVEMTDRMVERIGELNTHTGRIGEILEVIREIADRSDLLALNGALEASHAGDAGRGFALVASEMRRLAERVTASVQDVRRLVDDIRQSGSSTVMATEESKKLAHATTDAARKITLVTQQQRSSTEQVSESVRDLTDVVSQTVAATGQTRASSETLKDRADQLAGLVHRFRLETEAAE